MNINKDRDINTNEHKHKPTQTNTNTLVIGALYSDPKTCGKFLDLCGF